jgi:hypothetical protein
MVYVDEATVCVPTKRWPYHSAAHLVADDVEELHEFAESIGLMRKWFQDKTIPHYDVTCNMRAKAVRYGAIPITKKQLVERIQKHREESKVKS